MNSLLPDTGPKDTVGSGWGGLVLMGGAVAALLLRRMRLDDRTGRR